MRHIFLYITTYGEHVMTKIDTLKKFGSFNLHPERVKALWFQNSTFFDPLDLLQVRYEMLRYVIVEKVSKMDAAALFGVSRPTFYDAEAAFARTGLVGLLPQQRGPKDPHKLDGNVMAFLGTYLAEDKRLSSKDLAALVLTHFNIAVHPRSIERALGKKKLYNACP
jgi:transposase